MKYQRIKIVGDNGETLHIARGADGSLHFRTSGDVAFKPDTRKISQGVVESFYDVINSMEQDIPIGSTITFQGVEFTCWKAQNEEDCSGCALEYADRCPSVACHKDDRADRQNIIFIRKR